MKTVFVRSDLFQSRHAAARRPPSEGASGTKRVRTALNPQEPVLEAPALQVRVELRLHVLRQRPVGRVARREERRIVFPRAHRTDSQAPRAIRRQIHIPRKIATGREINSNDDFDVRCTDQTRTFSHAKKRVCRAKFENRIAAAAGKYYLQGLVMACRGADGVSQACMFSAAGARGIARAQPSENPLQGKQQQLKEEILRLANEDARFAQAILD